MTTNDKAKAAARAVLAELNDRSGFDDWWHEIDAATKREIREAIAARIREVCG